MKPKSIPTELEPTEHEIREAMTEIEGFLDITPHDFSRLYHIIHSRTAHKFSKSTGQNVEREGWLKRLRPLSEPGRRTHLKEIFWSWLAALAGIGLVAWLNDALLFPKDILLLVGSFGASAVLVYGISQSPLAQPRNFVGGQLIGAIVGVASYKLFSHTPWFAAAFAVATALALMHLTRTIHPPGGATALIAVIGGESIHRLGFTYVLCPVLTGTLVMLIVALILNNLVKWRRYPEFWL